MPMLRFVALFHALRFVSALQRGRKAREAIHDSNGKFVTRIFTYPDQQLKTEAKTSQVPRFKISPPAGQQHYEYSNIEDHGGAVSDVVSTASRLLGSQMVHALAGPMMPVLS